ncbi:DedA family protein [Candidatus Pacearchaeota archaeon]|nr:DedA family protein [Candidatus Pacearchaeota archaeon]
MVLSVNPIDFILHVDEYIGIFIASYGMFTYGILFLIILLETGLVVTPFLPGDSLLFVAGAFAAQGKISIWILFILLAIAAIIGDSINYFMGNYFGERFFIKRGLIKADYIERTKEFFKRHGGKTIIYARFVPIVRTFAPFVAGVGKMEYSRFLLFNIGGGISWIALFLSAGYFFGEITWVKEHLTEVIFLIIFISIMPPIIGYVHDKMQRTVKREIPK